MDCDGWKRVSYPNAFERGLVTGFRSLAEPLAWVTSEILWFPGACALLDRVCKVLEAQQEERIPNLFPDFSTETKLFPESMTLLNTLSPLAVTPEEHSRLSRD